MPAPMNPPTEDIKDLLLADSALALTYGGDTGDLFIGEIAETAIHPAIGLYDIPGAGRDLVTGTADIQNPEVQLRVRGRPGEYLEAHRLLQQALDVIHGEHNLGQGLSRYLLIRVTLEISYVKKDEKQRPIFSAHVSASRTAA